MKTWIRAALATAFLGCYPVVGQAQDNYTWNGPTSGTANWQVPANWTGGTAGTFPGLTGSGQAGQGAFTNTAAFGTLTNGTTVEIDQTAAGGFLGLRQISNATAFGLTIQNSSGTTGELSLDGRSSANPILSNMGAGSITIQSNSGGGDLRVRLFATLPGERSFINVASGAGPISISATMLDSIANTGLTKIGGGNLFLEGVNAYTGTTRVSEGMLHANSNAALGNVSTNALVEILTGATFQAQSSFSTSRNFLLSTGAGTDSGIRAFTGATLSINGNVTEAAPTTDIRNLVKAGSGLVNLNGTVTVDAVNVTQGSLGGSGTINAPVTVSSTARLTAGTGVGASTLTINNAAGGLNLGGDTAYDVRLFGTGYTNPNAADISKVAVTGPATLGTGGNNPDLALDLSALSFAQVLVLRNMFGMGNTQKYYVMTTTGLIGGGANFNFSIANQGNFTAGEWTYGGIEAFGGGQAVFLNFNPAPEPHAVLGIVGVTMGLLTVARRVRNALARRAVGA